MIERDGLGLELRGLGLSEQLAYFRMMGNGDLQLRVTGWPVAGRVTTLIIDFQPKQAEALEEFLGEMRRLRQAPTNNQKEHR